MSDFKTAIETNFSYILSETAENSERTAGSKKNTEEELQNYKLQTTEGILKTRRRQPGRRQTWRARRIS